MAWEYKVEERTTQMTAEELTQRLNELGKDDWDFVWYRPGAFSLAVFKRKLTGPNE